jgi:hypothetical protein
METQKQQKDVFSTNHKNVTEKSVDTTFQSVPVNAGKFVETLRHSTVSNISAIEDICDNCIDAGSSVINIQTVWKKSSTKLKTNYPDKDGKGPKTITISDNGKGMNLNELIECFKLGADSGKNAVMDIGSFGIGLKNSALSMCKKFTIITRGNNNEILTGVYDVNHIKKSNKFEVDIHKSNSKEQTLFKNELKLLNNVSKSIEVDKNSTGTVVILEDIDRFEWKNQTSFTNKLSSFQHTQSRKQDQSLDEVYRVYLKHELVFISVNGKSITSYDPIRDQELECPLAEESIQTNHGVIDFTIAELKSKGIGDSNIKGIGFFTRGFYIMRNDRQIMKSADLGLLPNKNNVNNLRIEMRFSPSMDVYFRTSNQKDQIQIDDNLKSQIGTMIAPYIKRVSSNNSKKSQERKDEKLNTKTAETIISQRSHLLKPIKGLKKEKRNPKKNKSKKPTNTTKTQERKKISKTQRIRSGAEKVEFTSYSGGLKGPMYDPEFTNNGKILVRLNRDHQFYNILNFHPDELSSMIALSNPSLFLIYCLSREELNAMDTSTDAAYEAISNLRYDLGRNMATLMRS